MRVALVRRSECVPKKRGSSPTLAIHWQISRAYRCVVMGRFRLRRPPKRNSPDFFLALAINCQQRVPSRHQTADRRHPDSPMGGACAPSDLSGRYPARSPHPILGCCACRRGPVLLELNYGGELNSALLAHSAGVLDERYTEHLARYGYRNRALREAMGGSSRKSRPVISTFPSSVS